MAKAALIGATTKPSFTNPFSKKTVTFEPKQQFSIAIYSTQHGVYYPDAVTSLADAEAVAKREGCDFIFTREADIDAWYEHATQRTRSSLVNQSFTHLALDVSGFVMANFMLSEDAAAYCSAHGYCHMPFNLKNSDQEPAPLAGTIYRA